MNIVTDTVTVVLESATDWTGPVIGIIGVALGSLLGLMGIRWQHDAQRAYDVRKLCAAFIHDGEYIHDTYLRNSNGMAVTEVFPFLQSLHAKSDEMTRTQRQLELIAHQKIDVAAHRYWMACEQYLGIAEQRYNRLGDNPSREQLIAAHKQWQESRDALIQELKPSAKEAKRKASRLQRWLRTVRTKLLLKKYMQTGKLP